MEHERSRGHAQRMPSSFNWQRSSFSYNSKQVWSHGGTACARLGVGFLPRKWMGGYVKLIKGIPYRPLRVLSFPEIKVIPLAYIEMILTSNPSKRVWPLMSCGTNSEARSRGTSIWSWPRLPLIVFADLPLHELPEFAPAGSCFA